MYSVSDLSLSHYLSNFEREREKKREEMRGKKERKIESLKWNVIEGRLMVWRHNWAPLKRLSKRY